MTFIITSTGYWHSADIIEHYPFLKEMPGFTHDESFGRYGRILVELNSLEDLISFKEKVPQALIITKRIHDEDGIPQIEIYDDYR